MTHTRLGQPEKSAAAEQRFETGHNIVSNTAIPEKALGYTINKGGY
jgi:hypothetical protein